MRCLNYRPITTKKIRAANKIKNKYLKKKIRQREKSSKISAEWLKAAGYQDTKDQDKTNYMFVPPKKETTNNIPANAAHFLRTESDSTNFKNENLTTKIRRNKAKKPYFFKKNILKDLETDKTDETIQLLDKISGLESGKNAQLTAKKTSEKYKKLREANARKQKYKIPGEIVRIEKVVTDHGEVKVPVSIEKPKRSGKIAAKKIIKKYDNIRREKKIKRSLARMK